MLDTLKNLISVAETEEAIHSPEAQAEVKRAKELVGKLENLLKYSPFCIGEEVLKMAGYGVVTQAFGYDSLYWEVKKGDKVVRTGTIGG